eukprot:344574_1
MAHDHKRKNDSLNVDDVDGPQVKRRKLDNNHNQKILNEENIDFKSMAFEHKMIYWLSDIDLKDKLLTQGYLRENICQPLNIHIPELIINYCIVYLSLCDEIDNLFIGNT